MDVDFWLQKWKNNDVGFHKSEVNPILVKYLKELSLEKGDRVFLPLCGKTRDIPWLLANDYRVAGSELIEMAVEQLFIELEVQPKISDLSGIRLYSATNIDIFVGSIFDLSSLTIGSVDAIYDRAALVALPKETRNKYTAHLMEITKKSPQLLVSYEYDQNLMSGPPFSVSEEELNQHYRDSYDLTLIASKDVPGGLKGKCAAKEHIWRLRRIN